MKMRTRNSVSAPPKATDRGRKPKSQRRWEEINARRSARYSRIGRQLETEVANILSQLQQEQLITSFTRHQSHSVADHAGRDFTVRSEQKIVSFGVTISLPKRYHLRGQHPEIPQFCFPIGTKPGTIRKHILELLQT